MLVSLPTGSTAQIAGPLFDGKCPTGSGKAVGGVSMKGTGAGTLIPP